MNGPPASGQTRRKALGYTALLLTAPRLAAAATNPPGPTIVAVRVWPARDYTRVTIESDQPLAANHLLTTAPNRLVVDLNGLELNAALRELVGKVRPGDPYIAGVRVGQYLPRVVRLVLDLKQPIRPEQFTLAPVGAYRHRLVFDLFPTQEADPLLALIRDKEAAEQHAIEVVDDALGELIARIDNPPAPIAPIAPSAPASPASASASAPSPGPTAFSSPAPATMPVQGPPAPLPTAPAPAAAASAPQQTPAPASPAAPPAPPTAAERQRVDRLIIVALDPGHGGEDPGAIGPTGLREKDVVLALALQLRDKLNALPGMRVMLTRDADFFVPLHERVRKARRVQADLFVSLHADAFMRPEARGASVFALSTKGASSAAARWMAARENAADDVGGVNVAHVRDPQLLQAMLDMSTAAQIKDSLKLGSEVLARMGRIGKLHKRQVEQAGFAVLKAPDVPSILVETAFTPTRKKKRSCATRPTACNWWRHWPAAYAATLRATRR